jgi:hypothetical protein
MVLVQRVAVVPCVAAYVTCSFFGKNINRKLLLAKKTDVSEIEIEPVDKDKGVLFWQIDTSYMVARLQWLKCRHSGGPAPDAPALPGGAHVLHLGRELEDGERLGRAGLRRVDATEHGDARLQG